MTEYDVQRTARAVVDMLLSDDRFLKRMERILPRRRPRMLNSSQAAESLGISQWTLREIAPYIGGIKKGDSQRAKWTFEEEGLKERYLEYINNR